MYTINNVGYIEIETNAFLVAKTKAINNLKKQVVNLVKDYCRNLVNGNQDFCYQDTMNKILFIELNEDLSNLNLIFN